MIVSVFLLEKEAPSKELSMSIQLGGVVITFLTMIVIDDT